MADKTAFLMPHRIQGKLYLHKRFYGNRFSK